MSYRVLASMHAFLFLFPLLLFFMKKKDVQLGRPCLDVDPIFEDIYRVTYGECVCTMCCTFSLAFPTHRETYDGMAYFLKITKLAENVVQNFMSLLFCI